MKQETLEDGGIIWEMEKRFVVVFNNVGVVYVYKIRANQRGTVKIINIFYIFILSIQFSIINKMKNLCLLASNYQQKSKTNIKI